MVALALVVGAGLGGGPVARADDATIHVVVNAERTARLRLGDLRAIFLKQQLYWPDGEPILPINQEAGGTVREAFSQALFGHGSKGQARYWNERYFQGDLPPPALSSDEAVRRYLIARPRAIGYIRGGADRTGLRVVRTFGEAARE
jgi:hypothetical protein